MLWGVEVVWGGPIAQEVDPAFVAGVSDEVRDFSPDILSWVAV